MIFLYRTRYLLTRPIYLGLMALSRGAYALSWQFGFCSTCHANLYTGKPCTLACRMGHSPE